ncbi:MAG: ZIP family metal transporter [Candidatus Dormibacteria bacterium]
MAILLAGATFFSTAIGGLVALRLRDRLHLVMGFAAGAVLAVVFFDLLPEIFHTTDAPKWVLLASAGGFLSYFLLERVTALHGAREHEHQEGPHAPELGVASATGLSIHSFLDGVAIGVGFHAGFAVGILISAAVLAHDFSDGLNTVTVMLAHGNSPRRAAIFLLIDATTPVLGALSTLVIHIPGGVLPWMLAFFAGSFIYIGASDMLPEAREHSSPLVALTPVLGMAIVFAATRALP